MLKTEVALSVRQHLEREGYKVSFTQERQRICVDIYAKKDKDTFFIEAIGESSQPDTHNIIFAIGKLIMRMKEQGFWIHYAIAIPRSYFKFLKDFEVGGFQALKIHVFIVQNFYSLTHLDPQDAVDLIQQLKSGQIVNPDLIGIDHGLV